ncbi:MAG: hypothetical protein AAB847_01690, partial [Patescibacteria group bacterium]
MTKKHYIDSSILLIIIFSISLISIQVIKGAGGIDSGGGSGGGGGSSGVSTTKIAEIGDVATVYQNIGDKSYVVEVRDRTNLPGITDKLRGVFFVKKEDKFIPLLEANEGVTLETQLFFNNKGVEYLPVTAILVQTYSGT